MPTTTETVELIGSGMQAIGAALKTTGLPVARNFGIALDAAGTYISGSASAITEAAGNKPISQIIGEAFAGFVGGLVGGSAAVALAMNAGVATQDAAFRAAG
jgi:hypothetical protein